jgi:hypothetical protein
MPLLTTSKLIAVFEQFAQDARTRKLIGLIDAITADSTANTKYEQSLASRNYEAVREAMIGDLVQPRNLKKKGMGYAAEIDSLQARSLALQMNTQYYLIKGFTGSASSSPFHIRFENPGEAEISQFHLTTEEGWTAVRVGDGMQAKGRFFFGIDGGRIDPLLKNRILGKGDDQSSDMRLASLVQDTMVYVYYLMYCLRTV